MLVCLFTLAPGQASTVLTTFGTDAATDDPWTYNSGTSTITGTQGAGYLLYNNNSTTWNLTSVVANVSLLEMSLTGFVTTNPTGAFYITLADSAGKEAKWTFGWSDFGTSTPTTVVKALDTAQSGFNLASIVNWNLASGGSGTAVNATFTNLTAVPEPSTGALMMIGAVGLVALRRLRKV